MSDRWKLPAAGQRGPHLLACLARFAGGSDLGCCGETAETSPAPRLLSPAALPRGHQQHCQGKLRVYQEQLHSSGGDSQGWPGGLLLSPAGEEEGFEKQ